MAAVRSVVTSHYVRVNDWLLWMLYPCIVGGGEGGYELIEEEEEDIY